VTGGRPLSFSWLIDGGSRSPDLAEGNAEGARIPIDKSLKRPGGSLGTTEKIHNTSVIFQLGLFLVIIETA